MKRTPIWLLPLLLLLTVIALRYSWQYTGWLVPNNAFAIAPTTADRISAASALLSALAFVGLLFTILLQHDELRNQQAEQADLAKQVAEQRQHLRVQTDALQQQAFENTFFHLLRLHNENVKSQTFRVAENAAEATGRAAFAAAAEILNGELIEFQRQFPDRITIEDVNHMYSSVCETRLADFGHYFRNLYHIVKYVDESSIRDQRRYTAQVRAQFSQAEYVLLFFNGLRNVGGSKFKPLIEKYSLLHEMRRSAYHDLIKPLYHDRAFGPVASAP